MMITIEDTGRLILPSAGDVTVFFKVKLLSGCVVLHKCRSRWWKLDIRVTRSFAEHVSCG